MKRFLWIGLFVLTAALVLSLSSFAQTGSDTPGTNGVTYIIPIKGPIERGLLYVVRRGLTQAEKEGAGAIVFDMDTPGGLLGVTEEIIKLLIALPENIRTYTFVNSDALSAGALIALATDHIYMAPGSRIGASALVSLFGDIPEGDLKEKYFSATAALVSSAARRKGHDEKLVEAMMRKETGYKIGDKVICPEGQLLTLTEMDAALLVGEGDEKRPLLSSGTVKDLNELLEQIGRSKTKLATLEVTWSEGVARWIEKFAMVFLIGGLLGLYIEFKTPGFGAPGITGIIPDFAFAVEFRGKSQP